MKNISREFCIFSGIYFVSEYIISAIKETLLHIANYLPQNFSRLFSFTDNICEWISGILFVIFVFLLIRYFFTAKSLSFVQNIMTKYPKTSVYLYYFGYIGYIVLLLNALFLAPGFFMMLNENTQELLVWCIVIVNTIGLLLPLILASRDVFFKQVTK